jgi:hypothetical protein
MLVNDPILTPEEGRGTMMTNREVQGTVAERLNALGVKGVLVEVAKNGQILRLRCEMPTCY